MTQTQKLDVLVIGGYAFTAAVTIVVLHACTACTPAEGQNRKVEAAQEIGLAGCITEAKKLDAGHDERMAAYTKCADLVDADSGRK